MVVTNAFRCIVSICSTVGAVCRITSRARLGCTNVEVCGTIVPADSAVPERKLNMYTNVTANYYYIITYPYSRLMHIE